MSNAPQNNLVMVIDDDEIMRLSCEQILKKVGYRVETFGNGHEGIERLKIVRPPLLVVDIKMPELDGFEVIKIVRKIDPDLVIVVITGYATIETAVDAMKAGAYDFLPKPFTPSELRLIIDRGFERWRLTKEAQLLRRQKEEVERKFVTLVSHQLKGPIGAVKQYLDVLMYTCRDQMPEKALEWITRSQLRLGEMLTIIQDWLALAKIDRGSLCERTKTTDLIQIVENIVREQQQTPGAGGITISTSFAPELPPAAGDPVSLSMLVSNLVGNAVKYNRPDGTVTISVSSEGKQIKLEVRDTGIGIPREFMPHLFEEFYRVKTPETEKIPGTGLGLVICKRIASELGGSIEVESEEGSHTAFTVYLPSAEIAAEVPACAEKDK
ncbi:MAG TPA: ATP-binding protein [Acidobacteriota bacterium]|nr:ATP-binding protein [Acidobacteriota bacterium]